MSSETMIFQVDSFTEEPFRGNPAGVCLLEREAAETWMQAVATEMNLSETAFVRKLAEGFAQGFAEGSAEGFAIRYFTPEVEVPLCGHATLASAHILWEEGLVPQGQRIFFESKSGPLSADREGEWVLLDFPADPVEPIAVPEGIGEALGAQPKGAYKSRSEYYLLELNSEEAVRAVRPDTSKMLKNGFGMVITTAESSSEQYDFVSRFFAPGVGINEDPVTGAAHCSLGPFWAERLGKTEVVGHQVSRRGGVVRVRTKRDRVHLLGRTVTMIRGKLLH